jgi:hypothetical protein
MCDDRGKIVGCLDRFRGARITTDRDKVVCGALSYRASQLLDRFEHSHGMARDRENLSDADAHQAAADDCDIRHANQPAVYPPSA